VIKVTIAYPNKPGSHFDFDYWTGTHVPLVGSLLQAAVKKAELERGLASGTPGGTTPFVAIGNLYFDSVEAFNNALGPHAGRIFGDIPNYTDITPIIQVSEVLTPAS
jgi:uncharacterized protein (TIGR02118 family)